MHRGGTGSFQNDLRVLSTVIDWAVFRDTESREDDAVLIMIIDDQIKYNVLFYV